MFTSLPWRDGTWRRLRVVHFLLNPLSLPRCCDAREEARNILRAFADLGGVEDYIMVVKVENERNAKLLTYWEKVYEGSVSFGSY